MLLRWRFAWVLALALLAGPAFALGLGQIQVRSQYGEPLLAEIPIVSSDPSELRQLQARLASPETFARIGLQPPQGLVQDLQFNVALDASGRPVIRVTSTAPVEEPLLTFLIEADWGQGRLVREYSALIDAPDTIAAPAQPPIQAPVVDAGDRIIRPASAPAPVVAVEEAPAPEPAIEAAIEPDPEPAAPPVAEAAEPPPVEPAATPAAAPAPPPAVATASVPGEYGPIQAGDTLSGIVQGMAREDGISVNQMMLALVRTNPQAFIGGNVNLLREGAVLRIPGSDEARQLSMTEATAEVRSQVARWREMSGPRPQPTVEAAGTAGTAGAEAAAANAETDSAGTQAPAAASALADARLEIAPATAEGGQQAGTRSGITAGGEGEMLRQELQETRESLAARDAEVEELKARLADLEQLQGQQQQLIELKDSELAAVQQRLAESNEQTGPTLAQANQDPAGAPAAQESGMPWLWIGLGLVLVIAAALAWARTRRDRASVPARRAAGPAPAPAQVKAEAGSAGRSPTWHAGGAAVGTQQQMPPAPVPEAAPEPDVPVEPAAGAGPQAGATIPEAAEPDPAPSTVTDDEAMSFGDVLTGAGERLELAKAYVELGDIDTARTLLEEVAGETGTPESSEAARLLSGLA